MSSLFPKMSSSNYLRVSNGKFVGTFNGVDISEKICFGKIEKIWEKEDLFKDAKIIKIYILVVGRDGERVSISFNKKSWFSIGFFQRIGFSDLSQELAIGITQSEQNEKISFCWIRQGEETIKKNEDFPLPEKVDMGGEIVKNWSKTLPAIDMIVEEIKEKLGKIPKTKELLGEKPYPTKKDPIEENVKQVFEGAPQEYMEEGMPPEPSVEDDDDLPF